MQRLFSSWDSGRRAGVTRGFADRSHMLFLTTYTFIGERSPEAARELVKEFGQRGPAAGEIAHYVLADGTGGVVIFDSDDPLAGYADALAYQQWMTFQTTPVLTIADALPTIMAAYG